MFLILLYFLAPFSAVLSTSITVLNPLEDQLPLIARVGQPYSWALSPSTFDSADGDLEYSTSRLPSWLSFDPSPGAGIFHGTPSNKDEGNPQVTVTAHDSTSSASSEVTLCVTDFSPPTLNIPISEQFYASNPSLSSVFILSPGSALISKYPALRIPPHWSFSIGFLGNTFLSENDIMYTARSVDGSPLPDWMEFDANAITLNGVVPSENKINSPETISLALVVSDQEGCMATSLPFDIIIASHEVALSTTLPTINITVNMPFDISLVSPVDFLGVLVDNGSIDSANISELSIDTTEYSWLKYDHSNRSLCGLAGNELSGKRLTLPTRLTTNFNQSIVANVSLDLVPSYFTESDLPPLYVTPGDKIQLGLSQYSTNSTIGDQADEFSLTAVFDPKVANIWLSLDTKNIQLTGTVPNDAETGHIVVALTAYSQITHSTSHASLIVFVSAQDIGGKYPSSHLSHLSPAAHAKLVLALSITFGIIGGLCAIGGFFAILRVCARVEDSALTGEEGRSAWSEKDKKWYGLSISSPGTSVFRNSMQSLRGLVPSKKTSPAKLQNFFDAVPQTTCRTPNYDNLGLGLRRVSERNASSEGETTKPASPGVMSKREFLGKIKETVRQVSDKYAQRRRRSGKRPNISKPILIHTEQPNGNGANIQESPTNPFEGPGLQSYPGSTIMTGSPSNSTGEHSIPRRRADFAPPRSMPQVHFTDGRMMRQLSATSATSLGSGTSARIHTLEMSLQAPSRPASLRSGVSSSCLSHDSFALAPEEPAVRPRLVPFTSSTRVPVPRLSPSATGNPQQSGFTGKRVTSQSARICKMGQGGKEVEVEDVNVDKCGSGDELAMGIHYVRSLGADETDGRDSNSPNMKSTARSSFSSLQSSIKGQRNSGADVMKTLVRIGERFKFRVKIPSTSSGSYETHTKYEVKLTSGSPLPKFIQVDLEGIKTRGAAEFSGMAMARDLGETSVGVYTISDGICVARVIVEVVGKK